MKSKIFLLLFYILFLFNSNLFSNENNRTLKVGLLVPLSGPYSEIGNSLLYSLQLALEEINDQNVVVVPRDSGFNALLTTIEDNKSRFSNSNYLKAETARKLQRMIGYPAVKDFVRFLTKNELKNCPVTPADAKNADCHFCMLHLT